MSAIELRISLDRLESIDNLLYKLRNQCSPLEIRYGSSTVIFDHSQYEREIFVNFLELERKKLRDQVLMMMSEL